MDVCAVYHPDPEAPLWSLPLMLCSVPAGFPSPADDFIEQRLDLTSHLVRNPEATFFVRAKGDSMTDIGIQDGALLVVDRSLEAVNGRVVVAVVDGALAVKRLRRRNGRVWLESEPQPPRNYPPIEVTDADAVVWGVVIAAVNAL